MNSGRVNKGDAILRILIEIKTLKVVGLLFLMKLKKTIESEYQ